MTFEEARQAKFERGRQEHGEPWDAQHIDAIKEAQDEYLDLSWYAELIPGELGRHIYKLAWIMWHELEAVKTASGDDH